jgi:hypothetical protein
MSGYAAARVFVAALAMALATTGQALAQSQFDWRGQVAQGGSVEIKGVNGSIKAAAASGSEVRVRATKTSRRRGSVDDVIIEVVQHSGGVTICAVYPTPRGRPQNECRPGSGGRNNVQDNDVEVEFTVEVPAGVNLVARNVNGGIEATGLASEVDARTVNGGIRLATAGIATAQTVNGSIDVRIGRANWRDELAFETVNGAISVTVTGDLNADVSAATVNGQISTDFPLTVQGRFSSRSISGTVGSGGRRLTMKTVNGAISLRRS